MTDREIREANMRLLAKIPRLLALVDDIREDYGRLVRLARAKETGAAVQPPRQAPEAPDAP